MGFVHVRVPLEAKAELAVYYGDQPTDRSQRLNFLPDAYLECFADDGEKCGVYPMALEVDMDTEPTARLLRKLENGVRTLAMKTDGGEYNLV